MEKLRWEISIPPEKQDCKWIMVSALIGIVILSILYVYPNSLDGMTLLAAVFISFVVLVLIGSLLFVTLKGKHVYVLDENGMKFFILHPPHSFFGPHDSHVTYAADWGEFDFIRRVDERTCYISFASKFFLSPSDASALVGWDVTLPEKDADAVYARMRDLVLAHGGKESF